MLDVIIHTWPMWAVVLGGFLLIRLCRVVYNFQKRFKRGF